jgi:hypothetical protein
MLVETVLHPRVAHLRQAEHRRPGGGLTERQPAGTACQGQANDLNAAVDLTIALDRLGLTGQGVEVEVGGKPAQQVVKPIRRRERCCVLHLP